MASASEGRAAILGALGLRERGERHDLRERRDGRVAILVVNGFDRGSANPLDADEARRFPWIRLCLEQLERHTPHGGYEVLVWDNAHLPEHREILEAHPRVSVFGQDEDAITHGRALDRLLHEVPDESEYVITLDTDCFPIRNGWLENLIGRLDDGASLTGIWRDEMAPHITPYIHPSCLAARRETLLALDVGFAHARRRHRVDIGQEITLAVVEAGGRLSPLRRSNVRNMHFVMGGVYADLVYHHGAGSRRAKFWTRFDSRVDEAARVGLRDAAFEDLDALLDLATGNSWTGEHRVAPDAPAPPPGSPSPLRSAERRAP